MSSLLIDAGNTRIKWARLRGTRLGRVQAAAWSNATLPRLTQQIFRGADPPSQVLVASVAGKLVDAALRRAARLALAPAPVFVHSTRRRAGVVNAYGVPPRLGVDRWVALIGARARWPRQALCIVGIGTAITADVMDGSGRHRGGWIVPGPRLMVDSLLSSTALIRRRATAGAQRRRAAAWARDTRDAIEMGAAQASAAVVSHAHGAATRLLRRSVLLVVSGGGARHSAGTGRDPDAAVIAPHLVLAGLAVLAHEQRS